MANSVKSFRVQGNDYSISPDLAFDTSPTFGSSNPVTSNGIAQAISGVTLGDSISYGRTADTPVGYASIAYGKNVAATGDYSIVLGNYNSAYGEYDVSIGYGNKIYGTDYNVAIGYNNSILGNRNVILGAGNRFNFKLLPVGNDIIVDPSIRIEYGYVIPDLTRENVIFYDDSHYTEIIPNYKFSCSIYCIDIPTGDIYEGTYTYNSRKDTGSITKLKSVLSTAAYFTVRSANIGFKYGGKAYYNSAKDKLYSDEGMTVEISPSTYGVSATAYFNAISNNLITRGNGSDPLWVTRELFKGNDRSYIQTNGIMYGREAYVFTDYSKGMSNVGKVYADAGFTNEITSGLYDGEYVIDIAGNGRFQYYFNADHVYFGYSGSNDSSTCSITAGEENYSAYPTASLIVGMGNKSWAYSNGCAIFGRVNTVSVGNGAGDLAGIISGSRNSIINRSTGCHSVMTVGDDNIVDMKYSSSTSDYQYIIGSYNRLYGDLNICTMVTGCYNNLANNYTKISIHGNDNSVYNSTQSTVVGYNNLLGNGYLEIVQDKYGIYRAAGVTYNETTKTYTFPKNIVMAVIEYDPSYKSYYGELLEPEKVVNYAISLDGTSLTYIGLDTALYNGGYIFGSGNQIKMSEFDSGMASGSIAPLNTTIVGVDNVVNWRNNGSFRFTVVGYGLKVDYSNPASAWGPGTMFLGCYNSNDFGLGAKVVVGIGTADTNRKNGLIIYGAGIVETPAAVKNINNMVGMAGGFGIDADQVVITYGLLKDYITSIGGGSGIRPSITIAGVLGGTENWNVDSSTGSPINTQTISVSGMTQDSIVILQPTGGGSNAFYTDGIEVFSVADGTLTVRCTQIPSVSFSIRVVYWP